MAKKKIHNANTNGFAKNPQNINRSGANRKALVSISLKEMDDMGVERVNKRQIEALFEYFLNLTEAELQAMILNVELPMLNRIVAKNMLDKRGFEIIERMLDRVHGKAMQQTEVQVHEAVRIFIQPKKQI